METGKGVANDDTTCKSVAMMPQNWMRVKEMRELVSTWEKDGTGITAMVELSEHEMKIGGLSADDLMRFKSEQVAKIWAAHDTTDGWFAGTNEPDHYEMRVIPVGPGILNIEVYFQPPFGVGGWFYQTVNRRYAAKKEEVM